jgi:hypothetical protein
MKKFFIPVLFLIFTLWQLNSLFHPGWPTSHDGIYHLIRIREYFYELKQGQFPVRWTDRLDDGYGLPLFNYIYPGPYLIATPLVALGLSEVNTYKLILLLSYFFGTFGFYLLFHRRNQLLALIAGLLYGLTPYYFLDIFIRGALGEVVALAIIPWIFYAFSHQKKLFSAITFSLLLISHNLLGFFFIPVLLVYLYSYQLLNRRSLISLLLALGLSSFFLLPAIIEKNLITSGFKNSYTFNYSDHFLFPRQLLYGKWDYWYSLPGPNDGLSFQLGFTNILICFISLFSLIFTKNKKILLLLILFFISLFFTLDYSRFIWQWFKPMQIIQFPWRFLFIPVAIFPLLFFESFPKTSPTPNLFAVFLFLLALFNTRNYRRPLIFISLAELQSRFNLNYPKTTTAVREEISPRWVTREKYFGGQLINSQTNEKISDISNGSIFSVSQKTSVVIRKNYFPGWQLTKLPLGKTINYSPDFDGNISAVLENGRYRLQYTGTLIEKFADLISLLSLIFLCYSIIKSCQK